MACIVCMCVDRCVTVARQDNGIGESIHIETQ